MPGKPKIIIVDDHPLFREGIKLLLETEGIAEIIAEADNGEKFLKLLDSYSPDIVLMDIDMPVMNGIVATKKAINKFPNLKVLVVSMLSDKEHYTEMIEAGAIGFLLKTSDKIEFENAISKVQEGESYFSADLIKKIIVGFDGGKPGNMTFNQIRETISDREFEVLGHFCHGFSANEIAEKLKLSIKTIEAHRSKLLQKTHCKNTLNLVLFSIKAKWINID